MSNYRTHILFCILYAPFVSAQSINWFETIDIKNFSSGSGYYFYAADGLANDSAVKILSNLIAFDYN